MVLISATGIDFTKDPCVPVHQQHQCDVSAIYVHTANETVDGVECDSVLSDLNYDVLTRRHHRSSRSRPWTVARVGTGTNDMAMASDVEQTTCYLTQNKER